MFRMFGKIYRSNDVDTCVEERSSLSHLETPLEVYEGERMMSYWKNTMYKPNRLTDVDFIHTPA
jgi:hypothetical protein